jgi:cystathionine beta-synthase
LLTRQNPAVLIRRDGTLSGIITRYDVLRYMTGGG